MNKEIEIRILEIDKDKFVKQILGLGAVKIGEFLQRRYTYDFNPKQENKWIRLRTNGKKNTITIKKVNDNTQIDGTDELEIIVDNFDRAHEILNELGYSYRNYQENYREIYMLDKVEISIDSWPMIPTYVELEGKSENDINNLLEKIEYNKEKLTTLDVASIYEKIYGIDVLKITELKLNNENINI